MSTRFRSFFPVRLTLVYIYNDAIGAIILSSVFRKYFSKSLKHLKIKDPRDYLQDLCQHIIGAIKHLPIISEKLLHTIDYFQYV